MKMNLPVVVLLTALAAPAFSAELIAHASVVRTEPVESVEETVTCRTDKPRGGDLVDMLSWDLCTGAFAVNDRQAHITGYRVYYEWDDRVFSRVMDEPPGERIPIRVRIR